MRITKSNHLYFIKSKLRLLMTLEATFLCLCFLLIFMFSYRNSGAQLDSNIQQVNHALLLQASQTISSMKTATSFPLINFTDRYKDPLLLYLTKENHGNVSTSELYEAYTERSTALMVQFPSILEIQLYDMDGVPINYSYKKENQSPSVRTASWFQKSIDAHGRLYIFNEEEKNMLTSSSSKFKNDYIYGTRALFDHLTGNPFCVISVKAATTKTEILYITEQLFPEESYALYDYTGQVITQNSDMSIDTDILFKAKKEDFVYYSKDNGIKYQYHIAYTDNHNGIYAIIRTPEKFVTQCLMQQNIWIIFIGITIFIVNIFIFNFIIRSIHQPISQMTYLCKRIGQGDFDARITLSQGDELSYLGDSLNSMASQIQQLIKDDYEQKILQKNLELQMLRSQINPHFLYNTLENMRMSAYIEGSPKSSEMCVLLSRVLRYGVSNQSQLVTVQEELEHTGYYISLLHYCYPNLQITVHVDQKIMQYSMIKVVFQPLIENCVNHAAKDSAVDIQIQLWGYETETDLIFTVSDNGIGIETSQLQEIRSTLDETENIAHHIGLKNIHRRLRLYYGESYGLHIDSVYERGTSVTLKIPKQIMQESTYDTNQTTTSTNSDS